MTIKAMWDFFKCDYSATTIMDLLKCYNLTENSDINTNVCIDYDKKPFEVCQNWKRIIRN